MENHPDVHPSKLQLKVQDIFTSGMSDKCEPAVLYKFMMLNLILIIGAPFVLGFGLFDMYRGIEPLGYIITTAGLLCVLCFFTLRITKKYLHVGYFLVFILFWMFLYLLATGGSGNSGMLWYYSFIPIVLFLLGSRKGFAIVLASLVFAGIILFLPGTPYLSASYSHEIKIRFIPSVVVLWSVISLFEHVLVVALRIEVTHNELKEHIKELEQAEEARKESEERYRTLFAQAGEGIFTLSVEGKLLEVNEAFARMHGYSVQEMQDLTLMDIDTPETARLIPERMKRLLSGEDLTFEVEHYHKDGHVFPLEISACLIPWRGEHYVQSFHRDISERKKTQEAIKKSENLYRTMSSQFNALLDAIPDSITLLSLDYKILWANRTAAERAGREPSAMEGAYCHHLWFDRTTPCEECPVRDSFQSGFSCESQIMRNGRQFEVRAVPVVGPEGVVNIIRVGRDITEQRGLEEQVRHAQKMDSVGTLAGGIAHDFNNILSTIIGYGQLAIMQMAPDSPQRQNIQYMLTASDKAAYLTQGLLAFSRKQMSNKSEIDVNELIRKSENFLRRVIREDIEFKTNLHKSSIIVFADPNQIEQVLMNLATNARDAMPNGGNLTLSSDLMQLDEEFLMRHGYGNPGIYGLITLSDSGIGIDEETRQRIFEPFFTTKEVGKGTGLGLSIIYGIIKQHDGYINVDSKPGEGTTFRIYLPAVKTALKEAVKTESYIYSERGTETILLAEDDEMLRKLAKTVLEEFGYDVIEAVDGEEAIRKFAENKDRIHLLISDLIMPKKSGKESYDEIKKMRPDIKVIFASGYSPDIVQGKTSLGKEVAIMYKPVSPVDLLKKVRSVLDKDKA